MRISPPIGSANGAIGPDRVVDSIAIVSSADGPPIERNDGGNFEAGG